MVGYINIAWGRQRHAALPQTPTHTHTQQIQ